MMNIVAQEVIKTGGENDEVDIAPYRHRAEIARPTTPLLTSTSTSRPVSVVVTHTNTNRVPLTSMSASDLTNIPKPAERRSAVSVIKRDLTTLPVNYTSSTSSQKQSSYEYTKRLRPASSILEESVTSSYLAASTYSTQTQNIYQSIDESTRPMAMDDLKQSSVKHEELYSKVNKEKILRDEESRKETPTGIYVPPPPLPAKPSVEERLTSAKKVADYITATTTTQQVDESGHESSETEQTERENAPASASPSTPTSAAKTKKKNIFGSLFKKKKSSKTGGEASSVSGSLIKKEKK